MGLCFRNAANVTQQGKFTGIMRGTMDKINIRAIRERCEKATPGPWHPPGLGEVHSDHDGNIYARIVHYRPEFKLEDEESPIVADGCTEEDAEFVASARTDLPALLDAVEEAKKIIERYERSSWAHITTRGSTLDIQAREFLARFDDRTPKG